MSHKSEWKMGKDSKHIIRYIALIFVNPSQYSWVTHVIHIHIIILIPLLLKSRLKKIINVYLYSASTNEDESNCICEFHRLNKKGGGEKTNLIYFIKSLWPFITENHILFGNEADIIPSTFKKWLTPAQMKYPL